MLNYSVAELRFIYNKMQSFIDNLDETAMKAAADFAYKESLSQKTIPHSEILNVVKKELCLWI